MPNHPRTQVAIDFNMKVILERSLRARMTRFHSKIAISFTKSVARNTGVPDFEVYTPELEKILEAHYMRVGRAFVDRVDRMMSDESKQLVQVIETKLGQIAINTIAIKGVSAIPVVIARHFRVKALSESSKITQTTKNHARKVLDEVRRQAVNAASIGAEQVQVASVSGSMFRMKLNGRLSGIVRLNTNEPAEVTKLTKIQLLRGEQPSIAGGGSSKGTKTWANQGDSRVRVTPDSRFNHLFAEQTVTLNKPFIVSGEQLRFPGDSSLGASIGNIIECRCSATYDIADTVRSRR